MGIILGLGAALCWGFTDFFVAVVSRRLGPIKVLCIMTTGALVLYLGVYAVFRPNIDYSPFDWMLMVATALVATATYVAFYKGLELGPVAIVAPIVAAYAAVVVLLSVVVLGERLTRLQAVGAVAALVGVILASADLRALPAHGKRLGLGVVLGIFALFGFGTSTFIGGHLAQKYEFIGPALIARVLLTVLIFSVGGATKQLPMKKVGRRMWVWVLLLGAMESAGYLAFAKGAEIGLISVVAIATATYPIIPLILGVTVFKERVAPNQWIGIAAVLVGVGLLSVGQ